MIFIRTARDFAAFAMVLQWAWHLGVYGYERMGVFGSIIGVMFSMPLLAVSPFTAWLLMDRAQTIWFYVLLCIIAVSSGLIYQLKKPLKQYEI
jgi:hypothetical protein